jgi:hypothetical protein
MDGLKKKGTFGKSSTKNFEKSNTMAGAGYANTSS